MKKIDKVMITALFTLAASLFVACTNIPKTPLDEIQNLRVENVSSDKAEVIWDSVKNAGSYQVKVENISSGNYVEYFYSTEPKYLIEKLEWAETYEISVNACPPDYDFIKYTEGPKSSLTFKTKTPSVPEGELARPVIYRSEVKNGTVSLNWNSIEGAAFYEIHREIWDKDTPATWSGTEKTMCVNATETSFTDVLPRGTIKVLYKVCARNSNFSNTPYWSEKVHLKF